MTSLANNVHMIAYVSDVAISKETLDAEIDEIVRVAKRENKQRHITGVLFHVDGKFLQVIEGDERELRILMKNIESDKRHVNLAYIIDTPVTTRGFKKWNMDVFRLGRGQIFDAATLEGLTDSFKKSLLPRADMLVRYYKVLLREKKARAE